MECLSNCAISWVHFTTATLLPSLHHSVATAGATFTSTWQQNLPTCCTLNFFRFLPLSVFFLCRRFLISFEIICFNGNTDGEKKREWGRERGRTKEGKQNVGNKWRLLRLFFLLLSLSPPFLLPPATRHGKATRKIKTFSLHFPFPH